MELNTVCAAPTANRDVAATSRPLPAGEARSLSQAAAEALAHREVAPSLAVTGLSEQEQSQLQSRPPPTSLASTANRGVAATSAPEPAGEAQSLSQTAAEALAHRGVFVSDCRRQTGPFEQEQIWLQSQNMVCGAPTPVLTETWPF